MNTSNSHNPKCPFELSSYLVSLDKRWPAPLLTTLFFLNLARVTPMLPWFSSSSSLAIAWLMDLTLASILSLLMCHEVLSSVLSFLHDFTEQSQLLSVLHHLPKSQTSLPHSLPSLPPSSSPFLTPDIAVDYLARKQKAREREDKIANFRYLKDRTTEQTRTTWVDFNSKAKENFLTKSTNQQWTGPFWGSELPRLEVGREDSFT